MPKTRNSPSGGAGAPVGTVFNEPDDQTWGVNDTTPFFTATIPAGSLTNNRMFVRGLLLWRNNAGGNSSYTLSFEIGGTTYYSRGESVTAGGERILEIWHEFVSIGLNSTWMFLGGKWGSSDSNFVWPDGSNSANVNQTQGTYATTRRRITLDFDGADQTWAVKMAAPSNFSGQLSFVTGWVEPLE